MQRCLGNTRFCLVLSTTAVATASPWVLSLAEALAMLLIYFLAVPDALLVRCHLKDFHYVFGRSTEDLLALALVRGFTIVAAHWAIPGLVYRRPYLLYAIAFAAIEIPFVAYKLVAMRHLHASHASRAPFLAMCVLQLVAAAAHVAAAEGAVSWARRRARMGLLNPTRTLSNSLEEGTMGGVAAMHADNAGEDVAPAVPDEGSQFFADVYTPNREEPDMHAVIQVHYKVALPCTTLPGSMPADGIVLIHSFGGGVHSWRHVLQPLADATSAAVVAFDRPGFGEQMLCCPPLQRHLPVQKFPFFKVPDMRVCSGGSSLHHVFLLCRADVTATAGGTQHATSTQPVLHAVPSRPSNSISSKFRAPTDHPCRHRGRRTRCPACGRCSAPSSAGCTSARPCDATAVGLNGPNVS